MTIIETYKVNTRCVNCGMKNEWMPIPSGTNVGRVLCPNCRCLSLVPDFDTKAKKKKT